MAGEEKDDETAEEWRSIVENYGDRAELEPSEEPVEPAEPPKVGSAFDGPVFNPTYEQVDRSIEAEQGFVAPDPGWQPLPERNRLVAWLGVLAAPAFLLIAAIIHLHMAGWFVGALVLAFVGGFIYLVWQMPREPREPWDDGSRI